MGRKNKKQRLLVRSPLLLIILMIFLLVPVASAQEAGGVTVRIKDVARLVEDRANQLTGFGLVVGLNGTGDGSQGFALDMVLNFLAHHGFTVDRANIRVRNVAAVALSATLPMYKQNGDELEVTVSSLGDAKSLQGGVLLQSPLTGADGRVYAVAQGPVVVGGMTEMNDNEIPWGKDALQIIQDVLKDYKFPIIYNFPAGHTKDNRALILGKTVSIDVNDNESVVKFE